MPSFLVPGDRQLHWVNLSQRKHPAWQARGAVPKSHISIPIGFSVRIDSCAQLWVRPWRRRSWMLGHRRSPWPWWRGWCPRPRSTFPYRQRFARRLARRPRPPFTPFSTTSIARSTFETKKSSSIASRKVSRVTCWSGFTSRCEGAFDSRTKAARGFGSATSICSR